MFYNISLFISANLGDSGAFWRHLEYGEAANWPTGGPFVANVEFARVPGGGEHTLRVVRLGESFPWVATGLSTVVLCGAGRNTWAGTGSGIEKLSGGSIAILPPGVLPREVTNRKTLCRGTRTLGAWARRQYSGHETPLNQVVIVREGTSVERPVWMRDEAAFAAAAADQAETQAFATALGISKLAFVARVENLAGADVGLGLNGGWRLSVVVSSHGQVAGGGARPMGSGITWSEQLHPDTEWVLLRETRSSYGEWTESLGLFIRPGLTPVDVRQPAPV